jgi:hypothetical protein
MLETLRPTQGEPASTLVVVMDIDLPDPTSGLLPEEVNRQASTIGRRLIDDPLLLTSFVRNSQERRFMAEASGDKVAVRYYNVLLQHIEGYVKGESTWEYDWALKRDRELTSLEAGTILDCLVEVSRPNQKERLTREQRIVQAVARGYINGRFEKGQSIPDWRAALACNRQFLTAALEPEVRLDRLAKWFDLTIGNYQYISPRNALFYRAIYLGARSANPFDEQNLRLASELQGCLSSSAVLFGRVAELDSKCKPVELVVYLNAALSVYHSGYDPTKGVGIRMYKDNIGETKRNQTLRQVYGNLKLSEQQAAPDILEVARLSAAAFGRFEALEKAREEVFERQRRGDERYSARSIRVAETGEFVFPYNVSLARSPLQERIIALQDKREPTRALYEKAVAMQKARGTGWTVFPFAMKGISGYMVVKETGLSPSGMMILASDMLDRCDIVKEWNSTMVGATSAAPSIEFNLEDVDFVIAREAYVDKTQLDTYLEGVIPDELTRRSLEVLRTNMLLQKELPCRFTRMPTWAGDSYEVLRHKDMPGVVRNAVIRKSGTHSSLEFEIGFAADPADFPDMESVSGSVDFRNGRVNVEFADNTPKISAGQKWILENVILQLIERSCCPSLQEVEEEVGQLRLEEERSGRIISIPGHVVHVGVRRADGTLGQPTLRAEYNLQEAIADLFGDAEVSLAQINEKHREEDPDDERFLTYNKGFELETAGEPIRRSPPEKLILIK